MRAPMGFIRSTCAAWLLPAATSDFRSQLAEAIRQSVANWFSDLRISEPAPRETIVDRLIFQVVQRVGRLG
jgi:hypothetical protein